MYQEKVIMFRRTLLYFLLIVFGFSPLASYGQIKFIENAKQDFGIRDGKQVSDLVAFITVIINAFLALVAVIAVAAVIWGGVVYMTSGGDENKAATGKKVVLYAIIGLFIVGAAAGIVNLIINLVKS